ncbi:ankyrin repeat domain-containing protein [Paucibacter sp. Y2R2-4]|uniref:ankyrin repeat domain-containing protein n=1 Tax=Paucibacter sp. Y2R2-4 TaxID=2893553 RepID=UPI0021E36F19|nr:ankyrin repeat domain-containing protein [Paucibacter sp. Y2R2-4]MCV2348276.1 ankyrin repeat domain-containing protein [Paucibacter sp. Y2R2-4]
MNKFKTRFLLIAALLVGMAAQAAPIDDLVMAAELDDGYNITRLLLRGVDPNVKDARGRLALEIAMREDSSKALESLLAAPGLDVNSPNAKGETPLMLAALKGRLDWVQSLVKRGSAVNREGWTPLHYACSGPDNGVAAWLLSQGANINARSPNGSTPLMLAAGYGAIDLPALLLKAGADGSLRNQQGLAAADFAIKAGRDDVHQKLMPKLR